MIKSTIHGGKASLVEMVVEVQSSRTKEEEVKKTKVNQWS
jgi:hypothetical protein